jgi:hypothetical protein
LISLPYTLPFHIWNYNQDIKNQFGVASQKKKGDQTYQYIVIGRDKSNLVTAVGNTSPLNWTNMLSIKMWNI